MSPRIALTLLALLVAVGLTVAWLWKPGARPQAPTSQVLERAAASVEPAPLALVDVPDPGEPHEPHELPEATARVSAAQRAADALVRDPDEPLRLFVHGVVRGQGLDVSLTELRLSQRRNGPSQGLEARADASGRYEFDATELLTMSVFIGSGAEFDLWVTHPWCAPFGRRLRVVSPQAEETDSSARLGLDSDGTHELVRLDRGVNRFRLDLELFESARVHGSLLGDFEPGRHQLVSVGATRPDEPAARGQWFQRTFPYADGSFELRLPPGARYAIVGMAPGRRPVTQWIDLPRPGDYSMNMELEPGLALSGRIAIAEGLASEGIGLELLLDHEAEAGSELTWHPSAAGFAEVVWTGAAFEWNTRSTRVRADGSFRIEGLAPRDYELRVLALGLPGVELRAFSAGRLRAPAEDLRLGPFLASLSLDLGPAPEGPLRFVLDELDSGNTPTLGPYLTDARGAARLFLPPHASFDVRVDGERVGRVTTGAVGEHGVWSLMR